MIRKYFFLLAFLATASFCFGAVKDSSFTSEEEKFINECVEKVNKQVLQNEALLKQGKVSQLNFAIDIRGVDEKNAFGAITTLTAMNKLLNDFHETTKTNQYKIAPYVIFTSRAVHTAPALLQLMNSLYTNDQLADVTYSTYEQMQSQEAKNFLKDYGQPNMAIDNSGSSTDLTSTYDRPDIALENTNRKLTEEILSRSILGDQNYIGVLLHYDFYIKGSEYFLNTVIATDKKIPTVSLSMITSTKRPQNKMGLAVWNPVFEDETFALTNELNFSHKNINSLYITQAVNLLDGAFPVNYAKFGNAGFEPLIIDENQVNCNQSKFKDFTPEDFKFILSNSEDYSAFSSDEARAALNRKLAFYQYNTKKSLYILNMEIDAKDADKIRYSSFANNVLGSTEITDRNNTILLCILHYRESSLANPTQGNKVFKFSFADNQEDPIFGGFESMASGAHQLFDQATANQISGYNYREQAFLIAYRNLPKPFVRYNVILNKNCHMMRTINIAQDIKGLIDMRELVIVDGTGVPNKSESYNLKELQHELIDEYIDDYHMYEAIHRIVKNGSCTKNLDVADLIRISLQSPPESAYGRVADYTQMAVDLVSAAALLLPSPYQVVVGVVVIVYYLNEGNNASAGWEGAGIALSLLTRVNVVKFLKGAKWIDLVKGVSEVSSLVTHTGLIKFIDDIGAVGTQAQVIGNEVFLMSKQANNTYKAVGKIVDNELIVLNSGWADEIGDVSSYSVKLDDNIKILSETGENLTGKIQWITKGFVRTATASGNFISKAGSVFTRGSRTFTQTLDVIPLDMAKDVRVTMAAKEIHFMQNSINNFTGDLDKDEIYYVIKNAYDLTTNKLSKEVLGPVRIWKNADGTYWTLDHRRLASYKLAGVKDIPITWPSQEIVIKDAFKMTTNTNGIGIDARIYLDDISGKFTVPSPLLPEHTWQLIDDGAGALKIKINGAITPLKDVAIKYAN